MILFNFMPGPFVDLVFLFLVQSQEPRGPDDFRDCPPPFFFSFLLRFTVFAFWLGQFSTKKEASRIFGILPQRRS